MSRHVIELTEGVYPAHVLLALKYMWNTGIYHTHVLYWRAYILHIYLPQLQYNCVSTQVIHLKQHTCITYVAQLAMYNTINPILL